MGKFTEATPITLFPPTKGINLLQPLPNMAQGYSPWLLNVNCETQSVKVRPGYVIHSTVGASDLDIYSLGVYGVQSTGTYKLFAYCNDQSATHKIYDVTAAAEVLDYTAVDNDATVANPFNFMGRLGFTTNLDFADCAATYDGSSWSAWGFTSGGSPIGGFWAVAYKSRVYIFNSRTMYYGAFEAVSGATSSEDLQYILDENANIGWAGVITSTRNNADEVYLAIVTIGGEVLVYGGDYPASGTWGLVGKFKVDVPLGYGGAFVYRNDIWILTKTGIVSVKKLFELGSQAAQELTVSTNIDLYWTKLIKQLNNSYYSSGINISSCFWPEKNQIMVLLPGHIDKNGTYSSSVATMAIFNVLSEGWTFHRLANVDTSRLGGLTYFNGNVYFYTQNVVMKVDETVYKDETYNSAGSYSAYPFEIQGAYSSYGAEASNKKLVACNVLCKTDFAGTSVGVRGVADFGQKTSDVSYSELQDGYNIAYYSVGTDGTYLQYRIEGNSDINSTDGFELFAVSTILVSGGRG